MSSESAAGMQEPVLNLVIRTFLKLLIIKQYCDGLSHIMEFVLCPTCPKINQPLDPNEKKQVKKRERHFSFILIPSLILSANFTSYYILLVLCFIPYFCNRTIKSKASDFQCQG